MSTAEDRVRAAASRTRSANAAPQRDSKTKTWWFVIDGERDPSTGKRRQIKRRGFPTKKAAQAKIDEIRHDLRTGEFVPTTSVTFREFVADEWLPTRRRSLEASTYESYDRYLRLHVLPHLGSVPIQRLGAQHLNHLYTELLATGRCDGSGGLSPRTVRYIHTILHGIMRDALKWGRIVRNAADAADPPRANDARSPEMRTWSAQELGRFFELVASSRYRAPWLVLASSGMRRGEVLGLRWRDLDLDGARLSIRQTITLVGHKIVTANRTKTGKGRAVDLDATTISELRAHRARQAQELLLLGIRPDADTLVFCHPDARPYNPDRFSREFDRALLRHLELPRIRLHDLRHTWATLALEAGVATKIVSERLGHATTAVTSDIYSHVTPTMGADAAEKVAGLIFGV